jgi:hypothetical protein
MSRSRKQARKDLQVKVRNARKGSRVIGLAAIQRSGAGAHKNRAEKRIGNARNDWLQEWQEEI